MVAMGDLETGRIRTGARGKVSREHPGRRIKLRFGDIHTRLSAHAGRRVCFYCPLTNCLARRVVILSEFEGRFCVGQNILGGHLRDGSGLTLFELDLALG